MYNSRTPALRWGVKFENVGSTSIKKKPTNAPARVHNEDDTVIWVGKNKAGWCNLLMRESKSSQFSTPIKVTSSTGC